MPARPVSRSSPPWPNRRSGRVARITFAQRVGLALEEIRAELDRLPGDRVPDGADWSRLSDGWRARIDERIAELERLRDSLGECIGCGCLSLDRCRLANRGDRAAAHDPGPRYWVDGRAAGPAPARRPGARARGPR